jgi:hypothetical protein
MMEYDRGMIDECIEVNLVVGGEELVMVCG